MSCVNQTCGIFNVSLSYDFQNGQNFPKAQLVYSVDGLAALAAVAGYGHAK
jgi:hypothetical protein